MLSRRDYSATEWGKKKLVDIPECAILVNSQGDETMIQNNASEQLIEARHVPAAEIRLLGPLDVRIGGVSIVPSAGKPKQLLALLAQRCGRVVPVSTLMEEIWGETIPRSSTTTLQTYILQLRKLITEALPRDCAGGAKDILVTHFNGYQLIIDSCASDVREFERLSVKGYLALESGDADTASKYLTQALEQWRGPALMDVPAGRVLHMESIGFEEGRMRAHEQRISADLSLGKHSMLVPELRMLVAQHPMDERFCAMLMVALHRSGAPWRALQVFRDLRKTLSGELGVEPSRRLQELHQAVLANTPDLSLQEFGVA
ncbi:MULTISPECIES: AfsR/SARP family transcriptional regulator [unclassified Streptomyces]|uniref:AfsR/SARP family transcriptional regulator n=1 Tax=unclassified Streptomyces TaxID=2593676 RepID=UPI002E1FF85A